MATYDFVSIKSDGVTQRLIDSLQKRGADGDYQNKEMDMLLNKKPSIERLYQSLEEFGKDRKRASCMLSIFLMLRKSQNCIRKMA